MEIIDRRARPRAGCLALNIQQVPSSTIHLCFLVLSITFQFRFYPCFSTEFMDTSHEFMTTQSSAAKLN